MMNKKDLKVGSYDFKMRFCQIAFEAKDLILKAKEKPFEIFSKGDQGLFTNIDVLVEKFIIKKLLLLIPNSKIIAEETCNDLKSIKDYFYKNEYYWIIDPIDGTNNFITGLPFYCISLALSYKGKIILGLVLAPELNECFYVQEKKGINKVILDQNKFIFKKVKPKENIIKKASNNQLMMLSRPSVSYKKSKYSNEINHLNFLTKDIQGKRRLGSAALELVYVSLGRLDAYWSRKIMPWDVAVGILMAQESGSLIFNLEGKKFDLFDQSIVKMSKKFKKIVFKSRKSLLDLN